jgi:phospholipid N-methyltransferase
VEKGVILMMVNYQNQLRVMEIIRFFHKFLQSPGQIGSIVPSSTALAKKITEPIDWEKTVSIVELGAGTGVFTRLIQHLKSSNCKFVAFEKDQEMRERLARQFPDLPCYADAIELSSVLSRLGIGQADCIVSGLPFANFSQEQRDRLVSEIYASLQPGGLFIAFQYSLQMKKQLETTFADVAVEIVPLNLPPAFVYVCRK